MKPPPKRTAFSSRKRTVTKQEHEEWKYDTRNDTVFVPEEEVPSEAEEPILKKEAVPTQPVISPKPKKQERAVTLPTTTALEKGVYHDVDARTASRFRKGKTALDGTLDLHGMSRETAYVRVMTYLQQSYDMGRRTVLIITGHGRFQTDIPASERGILRKLLPQWLNDPAVRNLILAFDQAQIKDGGQGAFYVFIRRKRA